MQLIHHLRRASISQLVSHQEDPSVVNPPLTKIKGVDFLFVDEAQDCLLADCILMRLLCKNPRGHFFAGDTAQTYVKVPDLDRTNLSFSSISIGSSFRFEDLTSAFWRAEQNEKLVKWGARKALHPAQASPSY